MRKPLLAISAALFCCAWSASALAAPDLPEIRLPLVVSSVLLQWPLMILLPVLLGPWLRRRFRLPLWIWGVGMASFITSQVVHLPLNFALGLLGREGVLTHAPLPVLAAALGLSAGLCEELTRYVAMRLLLKRHLGWNAGVLFGAGHGGIEALILGAFVVYNLLGLLLLPLLGAVAQQPAAQAAAWTFWTRAWYEPIYGGVERVAALMAHIGMSVLVMRAVAHRNLLWLLAAIGAHAALDGVLLPLQQAGVGTLGVEIVVLLFGALLLGLALALRKSQLPSQQEPSSTADYPSRA